jgi:hypothetical protein
MNWTPNNSSFAEQSDVYNAFQYTHWNTINSYPVSRVNTSYQGGGYVYKMNGNSSQVSYDLQQLQSLNWIDRQTRALFVEFSIYNPNVKLFSYCYILIEILPTGSLVKSYRFYQLSLFDFNENSASFDLVSAFIYLAFICLMTEKQVYLIFKQKTAYLKKFWSYIDFILIAFSFI